MRITHFVEDLNRGGLERVVIDLVLKQIESGHTCQVVCLFRLGVMADQLVSEGVTVRSCDKQLGFDLRALKKAREYFSEFGTEVLHTHNIMVHYYGVFASAFLRIKIRLNTRHNMGTFRYSRKGELFYRIAMLFSEAGVAVCEAASKRYIENGAFPRRKAKVIPNGILVDAVIKRSIDAKEKLLESFSLPKESIVIGAVGRLSKVKDHSTLIKAFSIIKKNKDNVVLFIVGGGELFESLNCEIKSLGLVDSVKLLGDRPDVYSLLGAFDIYAMSSISEGHSIALLEACAAALPIVATDVGGNSEIVQDNMNGLLVRAKDPSSLADTMISLIIDSDKQKAMGLTGRKWVEKFGSVDVMTERYTEIYRLGCGQGQ